MAQKILGIDIGGYQTKIAQTKNGALTGYTVEQTPDNMIKEGRLVSFEAMADFLKEVLKRNKIGGKEAVFSLPPESYFLRRVKLPRMTINQLKVNLPFEFRDFVEGDLNQYVYDYAVLGMAEDGMDLMAAATSTRLVNDYRTMAHRAGLKLIKLVPDVLGLQAVIMGNETEGEHKDYAVIDLGHTDTRIYFFSHGAYEITRTLNNGCPAMVQAVVDEKGVDSHIAHLYLEHNQDGILDSPAISELFDEISIEIMRVMNFYSYNNPNNSIDHLYYIGGGVDPERMIRGVKEATELDVIPLGEIIPGFAQYPDVNLGPHALGVVLE